MLELVFAIIPNYNNIDDLKLVVQCFKKQLYPNLKIIVVDNGSEKKILAEIKAIEDIILIENKTNEGWAAANNKGIRYALKHNADYIILANNDIFFDDERLIVKLLNNFKQFGAKSNVKILGPRNNYYHDKNVTHNIGRYIFDEKLGESSRFNTYRLTLIEKKNISEPFVSVDYVSGCFLMSKADIFKEIGFFDESLFMYTDEVDFCYRVWKSGFLCLVNKSLVIYHKVSTSSGNKTPFQMYYLTRNHIYFVKKYKKEIAFYYRLVVFWVCFINLLNIIFRKKKKAYNGSRKELIKAIIKGLVDGYLNNMGKSKL